MAKGRTTKSWTEEETVQLLEMRAQGMSINACSEQLPGRSFDGVRRKLRNLPGGEKAEAAEQPTAREQRAASVERIREAANNPPVEVDLAARIRALEAENARLREQKKWDTHSNPAEITGGVFTLRESDRHIGDGGHLISCASVLEEKACVLIKNYAPERIQHVAYDDWIAGNGIYKEQDLDCAVSDPELQIQIGAVKARRFYKKIREVTDAPIHVYALRGNHERGKSLQLGGWLFMTARALCEDIPNLTWEMSQDRAEVNLADRGCYKLVAFHGFGHSANSPNSPKFVDTVKDTVIAIQRKCLPGEHPRRIASGHTHWRSVGLERIIGLEFDTTGGLQRNSRVQLGMNQRPIGWVAYISPRGMEGDILRPVEIRPDDDTYERENMDPLLRAANEKDCGECLAEYRQIMVERGLLKDVDNYGPTGGR